MSNASDEMFEAKAQSGDAIDAMQEVMHHYLEAATVDAVYGEPVQNGETLILPAAEVISVFGFGMGSGSGGDGPQGAGAGGKGSGGGGGGRVLSRPVAAIVITPAGVRVEPIVDVTKIGLAALTAVGFMFVTMLRMSSRRRALPDPDDT